MNSNMENEIKVLDHGIVKLIDVYGSDTRIADAARTSYQKGTKTVSDDRTLIRHLMRNQHTSPLEFVEVTFYINAPLAISTQHLRHRMSNFCFESLRYSEARDENYVPSDGDITFQDPNNKQGGMAGNLVTLETCKNPEAYVDTGFGLDSYPGFSFREQFQKITDLAKQTYTNLVNTGMRRELARMVLPVSQYTQYYYKTDLNNFFKFLKLRLDPHAQYEIRMFAQAMFELAKPHFPIACEAFEDYMLNSMHLTAKDIAGLSEIINYLELTDKDLEGIADTHFTNKRERAEFLNKITKIIK